jgi:hypothetical protein
MIHSGLGGGSSNPAPNTMPSAWGNWVQQSIYGTTLWNPTTSYGLGQVSGQLPGLGSGGFPDGFDQWRVGLDRPSYTAPPATAPVKASNDWESMSWLFLGLL